jgi:predicted nuclease of predicted toxin-antitoxin system
MKFFFDNNLSPHLAAGMKAFGEEVMHLTDQFGQDALDAEWLPYVGNHELVLVTRDLSIRRHPLELNALKKHKVAVFCLGGKNRNRCELIRQLVRNWPRMKELAGNTNRPFAFRIPPTGTKFDRIPL